MGQALRGALQSRYGARNGGVASPTFSGRRGDEPRGDQHRHAHYLALPDLRGPRVGRLVVWAPEGFGAREVEALAGVSYLSMHEISERMPTALVALATESELRLRELLGPAQSWRSITPFGLVRHPKPRRGQLLDSPADQVRRELAQRGLPLPDEVILERGSWHRFRSSKAGQSRLDRAGVFGIRLRFSERVPGPLALGAFSHFGLGLFGVEERNPPLPIHRQTPAWPRGREDPLSRHGLGFAEIVKYAVNAALPGVGGRPRHSRHERGPARNRVGSIDRVDVKRAAGLAVCCDLPEAVWPASSAAAGARG